MDRIAVKVVYTVALGPFWWMLCFYGYVVRQRFHLGYWPRPSFPDPKDADFYFHHWLIFLGAIAVNALLIVFPGLLLAGYREIPAASRWKSLGVFVILMACFYGVLYFDPGRYVEWYVD